MNIDEKYELLKSKLRDMGKVVIAYSGGVDSNFLLKVASDELGQNAIAVTIHAMMHSDREMDEAKEYTKQFGVKHEVIKVDNFDEKGFIENSGRHFKICGQWKVYSDTKRAEKLFAKYAECSDRFCACLSQGQSIEDLVKAV